MAQDHDFIVHNPDSNIVLGKQDESLFWQLIKEDTEDPSQGWWKTLENPEKDGLSIKMWQRYMDNAPNMIKSELVLRNTTVEAFEHLI